MIENQGIDATFFVATFDLDKLDKSGADREFGRDRQDTTYTFTPLLYFDTYNH